MAMTSREGSGTLADKNLLYSTALFIERRLLLGRVAMPLRP
jgi:hypothetical protein